MLDNTPIVLDQMWMFRVLCRLYEDFSSQNKGRFKYLGSDAQLYTEKLMQEKLKDTATKQQVSYP